MWTTFRAALVSAQAASALHLFAEAPAHLARAAAMGAPREAVERQRLAIDQAYRARASRADALHQ